MSEKAGDRVIQVTLANYVVRMAESIPEYYGSPVALSEEFGLEHTDWDVFYLAVQKESDWPFLRVIQRYWPNHWAGSHPGILLVPETHILFVGAGERILAYDLKQPLRLWEDDADTGFHSWQRYDETIVMSAELELAAWDIQGNKLWTTFVEPPWDYQVEGDTVRLDVMGAISSFPLHTAPFRG